MFDAGDQTIAHESWRGKIPVKFMMDDDEISTTQIPEPSYMLLPRYSYLTLYAEKLYRHFEKYLDPVHSSSAHIWFDFNGVPLKWHYPLSVIFDTLSFPENQLPFTIVVHFQNFPSEEIIQCPDRATIETQFISTIKEGDWLKNRGEILSSLQQNEFKQIWLGFSHDNFQQFWSTGKKFVTPSPKYIPIRVYQKSPVKNGSIRMTQRLVPGSSDECPSSLKEMLEECFKFDEISNEKVVLLYSGIPLPLDCPVSPLGCLMAYPDNFIHLTIIFNETAL